MSWYRSEFERETLTSSAASPARKLPPTPDLFWKSSTMTTCVVPTAVFGAWAKAETGAIIPLKIGAIIVTVTIQVRIRAALLFLIRFTENSSLAGVIEVDPPAPSRGARLRFPFRGFGGNPIANRVVCGT